MSQDGHWEGWCNCVGCFRCCVTKIQNSHCIDSVAIKAYAVRACMCAIHFANEILTYIDVLHVAPVMRDIKSKKSLVWVRGHELQPSLLHREHVASC